MPAPLQSSTLASIAKRRGEIAHEKQAKHTLSDILDGPVGAGLPDAPRRGVNRYKPVHDWDGTIVPEIKGNAAEYLRGLDSLQPGDESQLAREAKGPITILTARPPMFHGKIRETGKRLGLDVGAIHFAGGNKVDKLRELNGILVDNNEDVADGITKALGAHRVRLVPTHIKSEWTEKDEANMKYLAKADPEVFGDNKPATIKRADNFLQRWLALHAVRSAGDESQLAREAKGPITIVTARPPMFHGKIRETAKRLGLDIGEVHHGGFDKKKKIKELESVLYDNNHDVVNGVNGALGAGRAVLVPTHTKAASISPEQAQQLLEFLSKPRTMATAAGAAGGAVLGGLTGGKSSRIRRALLGSLLGGSAGFGAASAFPDKVRELADKALDRVVRPAIGRVVTNLSSPIGYDNKFRDIYENVKTSPWEAAKSVWKDKPYLPYSDKKNLLRYDDDNTEREQLRDAPFRALFGMKPHKGYGVDFAKNPDGTWKVDQATQNSLDYAAYDRDNPYGPNADTSGVETDDLLGHVYLGKNKDTGMYDFRDPWDVGLNPGEKINSGQNALRWLMGKITKPVTFSGEAIPMLHDSSEKSGNVKRADSFLQRWLSLHAARDAGNQAKPERDAVVANVLGPTPWGEAINNQLTLGRTFDKRHKTLTDAVENVEDENYGDTLLRGLKNVPTYAGIGAGAGALSAVSPSFGEIRKGKLSPHLEGGPALNRALLGALLGSGVAMGRPLVQKAILDRTSHHAKRKAINIKAEHPTLTSLPGGDIAAALLHPGTKAAGALLEGGIAMKLLQDSMEQPEKTPEEIEADKPAGRGPDLDQLKLVDRRNRRPSVNDPLINELERMMAARRAKREREAL